MKDEGFKLLRGSKDKEMNGRTDICECRVAFATENTLFYSGAFITWYYYRQVICIKSPLSLKNSEVVAFV